MARRPRPVGAPRTVIAIAALIAITALIAIVGAATARAAWTKPFQFAKPGTLDYVGPQLAFSAQGAAAAAFGIEDVDVPGSAQAYLSTRSGAGEIGGPRQIGGARQILALAYDGRPLELLAGSSPPGLDCCSAAEAIQVRPSGALGRPRQLVGGLAGQTLGQLLALADGRMLAAVATGRGVWVSQSVSGNRFGAQRRISDRNAEPESLAAVWRGAERTTVAWTAGTGIVGQAVARSIYVSSGDRSSAPRRQHTALTVAAAHRIDELGIARRGGSATLAWIESWYDRRGAYHSRVEAADVSARPRVRAISPADRVASGLTFAGDPAGDQGLAWESCTSQGACAAQAAGRPARGSFGAARTLGAIDPAQAPALAISPTGQVVVGWVRAGHPVASVGFGAVRVLSSTAYADGLTVAYGPKRVALAAWSQGTLNPSIVGAAYHG